MADRVNDLLAELRGCTVVNCGTCKRRESSAACDGLVREAADVLQEYVDRCKRYANEIMALRERPRWISVTECLPAPGERVLAAAEGVWVAEAYFAVCGTWMRLYGTPWDSSVGVSVTHWMPLPDAPRGKELSCCDDT